MALKLTSGTGFFTVGDIYFPRGNYEISKEGDAAGAHRDLGTLTLIVEGVGGVSECDVYINHKEVR